MAKSKYTVFWFRRDLRLEDNCGLFHTLNQQRNVLPVFIFDPDILDHLEKPTDLRVQFIHQTICEMKEALNEMGSDLQIFYGRPLDVYKTLHGKMGLSGIYLNHDYEPSARKRDEEVRAWAHSEGIHFQSFKDQVIFEKSEILTDARKPYTVFTPYKRKWLAVYGTENQKSNHEKLQFENFAKLKRSPLINLDAMGFKAVEFQYPSREVSRDTLINYAKTRDFPALERGTSRLGLHLRFGTVSIRKFAKLANQIQADVWLSELIWREFFMQILWHYPHVVGESFRPEYEKVAWRDSESEFQRWCEGQTGYPIVDAGMRELLATGYMHNRVRMVTASFLCKHLLMYWLKGERYFAGKLLDYELAANNGNWQWVAGTGCDAAPYFRVFNPTSQQEKFDPQFRYIKKWVPEYGTTKYIKPMVDHAKARERCIEAFKKALTG